MKWGYFRLGETPIVGNPAGIPFSIRGKRVGEVSLFMRAPSFSLSRKRDEGEKCNRLHE